MYMGVKARSYLQVARQTAPMLSCVVFLCMVVGCIMAPVPMRTRTRAPGGEGRSLDLKFLQAGLTTKSEVLEKLGWIQVCNHERIFWGRWQSSSWATGGAAATPYGGVPVPLGGRHWKTHNLLVEFDEKGVVQRYRTVSDKERKKTLGAWLKDANEPVSSGCL